MSDSPTEKLLPSHAQWLFFGKLPLETTDESFRQFLLTIGIDLLLSHISVRQYPAINCANAKIAIPRQMVADLMNWVVNGAQLGGREVSARIPIAESQRRPNNLPPRENRA